jgi:hypothetical protein
MAKGDTLYAWQEQEPDGSWGTIAAVIPGIGQGPLVMRDSVSIARVRPLAELHAQRTGHPVRCARFDLAEERDLG